MHLISHLPQPKQCRDTSVNLEATNAFLTKRTQKHESKERLYIVRRCSLKSHWARGGLFTENDNKSNTCSKQGVSMPLLRTHTHTRVARAAIAGWDESRWRGWMTECRENTSTVAGRSVFDCAFTHLLSRQQIHSADGDVLGDVCTATIFPGRVTVKAALWCYRRSLPGCRWSLMNVSSGCAPSPPLCLEPPHTTTGCCCCRRCLHHGMQMTCVRLP